MKILADAHLWQDGFNSMIDIENILIFPYTMGKGHPT